jgi:hypothetical protein
MSLKIAHILGGWSPNIGNSFFQLGGKYVLKETIPDANFIYINEQPGYPSYWNPKGGNPKNFFDITTILDVDYLVLMGPIFRPEITKIWGKSFDDLIKRKTKIVLLGVGAMDYSPPSMNIYQDFLKKYPPYLMVTRDSETFEKLGSYSENSLNGMDFAFFISDYYKLFGFTNIDPYIALSFDKIPEPKITILDKSSSGTSDFNFKFDDYFWKIDGDNIRSKIARKSRLLMLAEGMIFKGNNIDMIGPYPVIRADHRYSPIFPRKTFRYPNTLVNDVPFPYFELYGNSHLTITNRVHAAVIALMYGKHAYLVSKSPRVQLFENVGVNSITKEPSKLNIEFLSQKKDEVKRFLKNNIK